MSFYDFEVIGRIESRLSEPPEFYALPETCGLCDLLLEDCENGIPGACLRCATCNHVEGECLEDCGEDHLQGCDFPAEECRCKAIAREFQHKAADHVAKRVMAESKETI